MQIDNITRHLVEYSCAQLRNGSAKPLDVLYLFNGTVPKQKFKRTQEFFEYIKLNNVTYANNNGAYSSLEIDLANDKASLYGRFDLVINHGLSQNSQQQGEVFRNIHHFTREKGLMVHVLFADGGWVGWSDYLYGYQFFKMLARYNDYKILANKKRQCTPGDILYSVLRKNCDRIFSFNFEMDVLACRNRECANF